MTTHKHYETAKRAYYNISFRPEKRAEQECEYFDSVVAELKEIGCSEQGIIKFERLFLSYLSAKSRCMSSMITGPANFPVRRAEKANNAEHNASVAMTDYLARVRKAIDREKNPTKYGISSDNPDALELLREKLASMEQNQELMKAVNKVIRKKPLDMEKLTTLVGNESVANQLLKPNYMGKVCGFESWQLSNNNANMKRVRERIAELEKKQGQETREYERGGAKVLENTEDNRLQLFFDGKPEADIIQRLKSRGFKWSPRNVAWQRQLTANAIDALDFIFPTQQEA